MTAESFRILHRFLNTNQQTPLGRGLALPVGDSFFLYRSEDSPSTFSYFEGLSDRPSAQAGLIREAARAGLLDTLHTYGDFSSPGDFSRDLARRGIERMEAEGIRLKVWVAHGTASNSQNFGLPERHSYGGDDPASAAYHTDLTLRYGIAFAWLGNEPSDWVGHDAARQFRTGVSRVVAFVKQLARHRSFDRPHGTRLLRNVRLRDGQTITAFKRFMGTAGRTPTVEDLPTQLSRDNLRVLAERGGYSIVYQHLGVRRKAPGFGPASYEPNQYPYLGDPEISALQALAEQYAAGRILVTTTSRLLSHNLVQRGLSWRAAMDGNRTAIRLKGLQRSDGGTRPLEIHEIEGLTFYCDQPEQTSLLLDGPGTPLLLRNTTANPPDHTGRRSISIALGRLECPDL